MRWTIGLAAVVALLSACGTSTTRMDEGPQPDPMDMGPQDPCAGIEQCETEGSSCRGLTLVTCSPNPSGCLLETETDCGAVDGGFCDVDADPDQCAVDRCFGLPLCDQVGRGCDGDTLTVCEMNADGCLVETVTDCAASNGVCDPDGEMAMCILPPDPCEGLADACDTAGISCDGNTLVECNFDAFGCLVETRTACDNADNPGSTCDAEGLICAGGAACAGDDVCGFPTVDCDGPNLVRCRRDPWGCLRERVEDCSATDNGFCPPDEPVPTCEVSLTDACLGVEECDEVNRSCSGEVLTVCAPDAFGCQVETITDCAATDAVCLPGDDAMCDQVPCPAARVVLDCDSGTIAADTSVGGAFFSGNDCDPERSYMGDEVAFTFLPAESARVTITATPDAATTEDFNLFVLEGDDDVNSCDDTAECLGSDLEAGAAASVTVDVRRNDRTWILYDLVGATPGPTTTVDLTVTCEVPVCGDGILGAFETCDDGNLDDDDGCSDSCVLETGFECFGAPSVCNLVCSNGRLDPDEECDDGNAIDDDGCGTDCEQEPGFSCTGEPSVCVDACGNGVIDPGETCDDGNDDVGDGCSRCAEDLADGEMRFTGAIETTDPTFDRVQASCLDAATVNDVYYDTVSVYNAGSTTLPVTVAATWVGDGYLHVYEGSFDPDDAEADCVVGNDDFGFGGSQVVFDAEPGERYIVVASTFSDLDPIGSYVIDMTFPFCGNEIVTPGEECDDGNTATGDGCDDACEVEATYTCRGSVCDVVSCGNSMEDVTESCDDGNTTTGDGCSSCAEEISATSGSVVTFTGDVATNDGLWDRAEDDCTAGFDPDFYFDEHHIVNETGAAQTVTIFATWPGVGADGYLHVYDDGFDPAAPLVGCLSGNDDAMIGVLSESEIVSQAIADGEELVIVASTFSSLDTVTGYTITVTTD